MVEQHILGNVVRVTLSLADKTGEAADPTNMRCRWTLRGSGIETEATVVADVSTGTAYADIVPAAPGWYDYRWWRSSGAKVAAEGTFEVLPSLLAQPDPA